MCDYDHDKILNYWQSENVESMYDKHLLQGEIDLICRQIKPNSKILDAGCGEGEGTIAYSNIPGVTIHGADFSETRLNKARERLKGQSNVYLKHADFTASYELDDDYDYVICQRFLINITDWEVQKKVLMSLMGMLKATGMLIVLEGYLQGANALNGLRSALSLPPIQIKWHNLFIDEEKLLPFMTSQKLKLIHEDGLGTYFMLTRGIRPALQSDLNWDCEFNNVAGSDKIREMLPLYDKYSRVKLWCFQNSGQIR